MKLDNLLISCIFCGILFWTELAVICIVDLLSLTLMFCPVVYHCAFSV